MIKERPARTQSIRPGAASCGAGAPRPPPAGCWPAGCWPAAARQARPRHRQGAATQGSGQGQSITLYSGQHEQTTNGLVTAFEKQTGIKVNVRNDDEDTLANLIAVQGSHTPGDVFFTENSPPLEFLQEKGLLSKVNPATLAHTPAKYNSPDGNWVGVSARVSVMVYNPSLIAKNQLPTSVMQLADPKYQGKLGIAPSETDFQPIVTSVTRTYGRAAALSWLEKVKSNAASHSFPDNETLVSDVNRGQVAFGIINEYYWYRLKAEIGAERDALADHLLRPARPRLRDRRLRRGGAQVQQAPGGRAEVPRVPGQQEGRGDHRPGRWRRAEL